MVLAVVPHAGTWIEIESQAYDMSTALVVPHAGTWIEMIYASISGRKPFGRSPRGNVD